MSYQGKSKNNECVSILDRPLRVLHLEDSLDDRQLIQDWITHKNIAAEFTSASTESEFRNALEKGGFDLILADKRLPNYDGMAALALVREKHPHVPFIFVTGILGEEAACETIKEGATDYVLKDKLVRLIPALHRAINESEREERNRRAEEKIRQQSALLDKSQDAILVKDLHDRVQYWNKSAENLYGVAAEEITGSLEIKFVESDPGQYHHAKQSLLEHGTWRGELSKTTRDGKHLTVNSLWSLVRDDAGAPQSVFIIDTDVTEKRAMEMKLLRSQRMDSLGALSGGIAHDLNNALAPVLIGADLLSSCDNSGDKQRYLDIITSNTRRAIDLVRQILTFARGTGNRNLPVQLHLLINEMKKMIQETFPKSIMLTIILPEEPLWAIRGDATEIHQVLLNLCVNARDAMPKGGRLIIRAENVDHTPQSAVEKKVKPGPHIMISVSDTGEGIPKDILPRICEPFFTTKLANGTGLGLSTVTTIVRNHEGFMAVESEVGKGTEFKVYLPSIVSRESNVGKAKAPSTPMGNGEWVLLIDDEETLVELSRTMLEGSGYKVVTALNGLEGIAKFREHQDKINLVITDSDMPFMNGAAVIRSIKEYTPTLPIIIASGTKCDTEELRRTGYKNLTQITKPYNLEYILKAVQTALRMNTKEEPVPLQSSSTQVHV